MKINQLSIKSHQVLKDREYSFKPGFNLVFGYNEQGKSLTLDTLIKLLFGKESKKFNNINRVEEDPAQYGSFVSINLIQDGQEKIKKLQGKPSLTDIVGLSVEECQNLFLIRNSNLSIGKDLADQDQFYTTLTDRLTGLKTQEIQLVKNELRHNAKLTDKTDTFQNKDDDFNLKDRLDEAQTLISADGKITQLIKQNKKENWSDKESEYVDLKERLNKVNQQLGQLEIAKKKQEYQSLLENVDQYDQLEAKLELVKEINQEQLNAYQLAQQELKNLKETETEIKEELKTRTQQLENQDQKQRLLSQEITRKNNIIDEFNRVNPELRELKQLYANKESSQNKNWQTTSTYAIISLLMLFAVVYVFQPSLIILGIITTLFISLGAVLFKLFIDSKKEKEFDIKLKKTELNLAKFGIETTETDNKQEQIVSIIKQIHQQEQDFDQLKQQRAILEAAIAQTKTDIAEREQKRNILQSKKEKALKKLTDIKGSCHVKNLAELQEKLNAKLKQQNKQQKLGAIITNQLDFDSNESNNPSAWKVAIQRMKYLEKIEIDLTYSQELVDQLSQEKQVLETKLETLGQELNYLKNQLRDLEKEINNKVLKTRSEPLLCEAMSDLIQANQEIKQFIKFHHDQRKQALDTIKILDIIEQQEKEKVGELFGQNSIVSQYFKEITNNRYDSVIFDQKKGQISTVLKKDNIVLSADKLSSGTYDQLYFAIRLGLGQKLLNEKTGFFIFDDPFLKSDQKRLGHQLDVLLNFASKGWQIIYFSAKEEVRDYLKDKTKNLITIKN